MLASIDFNNPGVTAPVIASFAPIVIGAVTTHFKLFVDSPKDFRDRVTLKRKSLHEQIAVKHANLLNRARKIDSDDSLRGDGVEEPDLVGEYNRELFRLFVIFHRVEVIRLAVKLAYYAMYVSIALGIIGTITSLLFDGARKFVLGAGIVLVVLEMVIVLIVFLASERLEAYEETT